MYSIVPQDMHPILCLMVLYSTYVITQKRSSMRYQCMCILWIAISCHAGVVIQNTTSHTVRVRFETSCNTLQQYHVGPGHHVLLSELNHIHKAGKSYPPVTYVVWPDEPVRTSSRMHVPKRYAFSSLGYIDKQIRSNELERVNTNKMHIRVSIQENGNDIQHVIA